MELTRCKVGRLQHFRLNANGLTCVLLALIFATAGLAKIQRFDELESTLIAARLAPLAWVRLAATAVITLELTIAVSLCISRLRPAALQTAALLVCVFIGYSVWRWWQNISVPCHCFGVLFTMAPWQSLVLDLALLGLVSSLLIRVDAKPCCAETAIPAAGSTAA